MRRANGSGHITKLAGNRRKPFAIRKIVGWTEKGTPQYKYISYHKTKREAERALNKYIEDPYDLDRKTLAELYREWFEIQEREKAPGTLRSYRIRFDHLKPLHDMKISEINAFTLEKHYEALNISKASLDDVNTLINLLFKYAVKRRYLPLNALNMTKAINMPVKEEKHFKPHSVISSEDIQRLWELKDENEYAKIILVYIYTGMRYSELKNLNVTDWHGDHVEIGHAKTAAGVRTVPICQKIRELTPIASVPPMTTFSRYFKELLPDHAPHDTRHTFISMLTEKGVDVRIIKAIVGHKMPDVTAIYTHISLDKMLEAVNLL